jgi:hypothetical protein
MNIFRVDARARGWCDKGEMLMKSITHLLEENGLNQQGCPALLTAPVRHARHILKSGINNLHTT